MNILIKTKMQFFKKSVLILAVAATAFLMSCGDDDDTTLTGSINVTVSGLPAGVAASAVLSGEGLNDVTITGSTTISDVPAGTYVIDISTVESDGTRYDATESTITVVISDETPEEVTIAYAEFSSVNGIVGTWVSKGDDVASLLVSFFFVDSIVAVFNANQTYEVLQYAGGSTAPLTLEGTYVQNLSNTGAIWNITVEQTVPSALTSTGIFEINPADNPNSMQYEIVQTNPDIGALPPTPEAGFGSTSGGALGDTNIQVYRRRDF